MKHLKPILLCVSILFIYLFIYFPPYITHPPSVVQRLIIIFCASIPYYLANFGFFYEKSWKNKIWIGAVLIWIIFDIAAIVNTSSGLIGAPGIFFALYGIPNLIGYFIYTLVLRKIVKMKEVHQKYSIITFLIIGFILLGIRINIVVQTYLFTK